MDPESLRRCMSFGFSDKNCSSIGQCMYILADHIRILSLFCHVCTDRTELSLRWKWFQD